MKYYFHWSPQDRRDSIQRYGLLTHQYPSCTRHPHDGFRQSSICLSDNIEVAWQMSAEVFGKSGQMWDLWFVLPEEVVYPHYCASNGDVLEYRTTENVPPSNVWRIIEREYI